ncbi:MAG TPA: hypothetical protein VKU77_18150 [Streptosporangiaceae bacterium]|nr:hypothetical protein [Streptosporangiaceae bacterium]
MATTDDTGVRVQQGGSGEPVLLLLHGLGATGDVWQGWWPLLPRLWPGPNSALGQPFLAAGGGISRRYGR